MKKIIFLLLCCPLFAGAQAIDVRGFGGMMINGGTSIDRFSYDRSRLNPLGGLGVSYRKDHVEVGISMSYRRFSFQKTLHFADAYDPLSGYAIPGTEYDRHYFFRQSAATIGPVFNYHFGSGRIDWYAGLSPMYTRYANGPTTDRSTNWKISSDGIALDAQVGGSYEVLHHVRAFAELSAGSFWIPSGFSGTAQFFTASLNLGAQLRVWEKRPRQPEVIID